MKKIALSLGFLLILTVQALAQEFEIKRYDLDAEIVPEEFRAGVQARLRLVNLSGSDLADRILLAGENKPRLSFFINQKAKIESVSINNEKVEFRTSEDVRNSLLRIYIDITTAIASAREFDVDFKYQVPSADRNISLHISRGDSFLLPGSFWVPVVHTPYAEHGADTAPFTLNVKLPAGMTLVSSGIRKSESSFEQSLAGQPFFIVGDYEMIARGAPSYPVEVYLPRGLDENGKEQARRIAAEAERMIAFYVKYFDAAAVAPFRVISTQARQLSTATTDALSSGREVAFATPGAVTLDDNVFRRDSLDLGTIELLASAAARAWVDGQVLLRGRGTGMLRDGLPIYLAAQYLTERYGVAQGQEAFDRYRRAYSTIARSDAPLLMQSQIDRNYTTSVYNKGALVWRMIEKQLGKEKFENAIRSSLSRARVDILSLNEWPSPLCGVSRCANLKNSLLGAASDRKAVDEIFINWIDTVILPDFVIGQPQTGESGVESTIANFGTGEMKVDVLAITDKGEKLTQKVLVKASEYGSVNFPAGTRITRIEADPERVFIQSDYANDVFPRQPSESEAFGHANLAMSKNDFVTAEAKSREALKDNPGALTLKALLGRALLGQDKLDEAASVFGEVLKTEPLTIQAYGWSHQGLGEIALKKNNAAEAARHFKLATAADLDAASTIANRDGALKAERALNAIRIPEDISTFLQRFDAAILQSTAEAVNPMIEMGNLRRFAQSLVVRKPSNWVTEALRTEEWDANRTAIDVTLKIRIEGKDYSGRAVYVISRLSGKPLLSEVPVFDVK